MLVLAGIATLPPTVHAAPFGKGVFGADVPFGSATSLTIGIDDSVSMMLTPSGPNLSGTGSQIITVTSTDVVGYGLYIHNPSSTDMDNGTDTIAASGNSTAAPLSLNTWGYNTDGSTDYIGLTTTQTIIRDRNGPFKNGDDTTVTFGTLIDTSKSSGTYTIGVTYTAVGKS